MSQNDDAAAEWRRIDRSLTRSSRLLTATLWLFLLPVLFGAVVFVVVLVWLL